MHDESREDVGDGEEEEEPGRGRVDDVSEDLPRGVGGSDEVLMGEDDSLG